MQDSTTSKEKVLKLVRQALIQKALIEQKDVDQESEIYTPSEDPLELQFAQNFAELNGKFVFCESENEFIENINYLAKEDEWKNIHCKEPALQELLKQANIDYSNKESDFLQTNIGITFCECIVARTGSIIASSKQLAGRRLFVYPNVHIVVAYASQLVVDIKDALKFLKNKYNDQLPSMITSITGPSRTADIEKTLVQGAHGPKEIFLFLIDDISVEE
jgi:L-lactate dehydrogenase complex protein LldG